MREKLVSVKAITVWQPWASLIVHGFKQYETRRWRTSHRGLLAIHAAKRAAKSHEFTLYDDLLRQAGLSHPSFLRTGEIIGFVELEGIFRASDVCVDARELDVGDFAHDRWAWKLTNRKRLIRGIKARGQRGIWTAEIEERYLHFCEHDGCDVADAIQCRVYDPDQDKYLYEHFCAEHCQEHGYCYGCGEFWAGCESFDFSSSGLCPNCRADLDDELEAWDCDPQWEP